MSLVRKALLFAISNCHFVWCVTGYLFIDIENEPFDGVGDNRDLTFVFTATQ